MDKRQRRAEWGWWAFALGIILMWCTGMVYSDHPYLAIGGGVVCVAVFSFAAFREWRNLRFAALMNGEERVAEWLDEDDRPVCIGAHAVFANGRFVCWRGIPKELQRAEYNPKSGIFKFVLHYPSGGIMPWRARFSARITVPPAAVEEAKAAERYFSPWAKNHRRRSVGPSPPTGENA